MPYSVLIVDDEMLIREGLRRHLDWATLDMEVIGVADGAESALEIARAPGAGYPDHRHLHAFQDRL